MKRVLTLLLATLMLVLVGCDGGSDVTTGHTFSQDEDGYGVTDTVTGIHYTALDFAFEPATTAAVVGTYTDGVYKRTFYQIKGVDTALYVADDELGIWYAGSTPPVPAALTVSAALVCEETSYSDELYRYKAGEDDEMIAAIRALWFEGEAGEYPTTEVVAKRRIRLVFAELPNIYYCIDFGTWAEGSYFYDKITQRAIPVPAEIAQRLSK